MSNWIGTISIQQAYAELKGDPDKPFWIAFVRATGKNAGSIKIVSRATYGAPRPSGLAKSIGGQSYPKGLHTDKGTLPITDTTTGEYLTPLISHIIGFNLMMVKH